MMKKRDREKRKFAQKTLEYILIIDTQEVPTLNYFFVKATKGVHY